MNMIAVAWFPRKKHVRLEREIAITTMTAKVDKSPAWKDTQLSCILLQLDLSAQKTGAISFTQTSTMKWMIVAWIQTITFVQAMETVVKTSCPGAPPRWFPLFVLFVCWCILFFFVLVWPR